jgi:DNA-binding response OmpR family regulator
MGADDFLAKPFNPLEMMSRCRSLLRRRSHYTAPRLCFGRVELNRVDHTVTYDGVPIDLSTQECKLLEFMVQLQGKRFTRSELLPQMGQSMPAANPHLGCAPVNYPRRKLSVAAPVYRSTDSAIVTVCGVGYRLQCTCHGPKPCLVHPSRPILKSPQQS